MVNTRGELVGLIFDGNIQSLVGSYVFDPAVNRSISVHSGGILEALRKVYGAEALADELISGRRIQRTRVSPGTLSNLRPSPLLTP